MGVGCITVSVLRIAVELVVVLVVVVVLLLLVVVVGMSPLRCLLLLLRSWLP